MWLCRQAEVGHFLGNDEWEGRRVNESFLAQDAKSDPAAAIGWFR